jgi:UV DNA damage endonuclease
MATKRRAAARLHSQSSKESNDADEIVKDAPRRSGRRSGQDKNMGDAKGVGVLPKNSECDRSSVATEEVEEEKVMAEEGVNRAIQGLVRMERRLQRAVKRQKLKVEESIGLEKEDSIVEKAFKPRSKKGLTETVNGPLPDKLPTSDVDGKGSDCEKNVEDASEEAVERGAARPPPVNSDYLPLPWKGRLGYVSFGSIRAAANY